MKNYKTMLCYLSFAAIWGISSLLLFHDDGTILVAMLRSVAWLVLTITAFGGFVLLLALLLSPSGKTDVVQGE